jgi:hypothetical protein
MHKVSRHVTVMVMFVVPLLGLTAPAASAASALNITPATGLIDGQTVHLVATGLAADSGSGIEQCLSGHQLSGCDPVSLSFASTDAIGGFSTDFVVRTIMHTPDGTFDCRTASCVIGTNTTTEAAFDPTGPLLPSPVAHATPTTGLTDGQIVSIDGTGFRPNSTAGVVECIAGGDYTVGQCSTANFDSGLPGPDGSIHFILRVRTILTTDGGTTVDCRSAIHACELQTGQLQSPPAIILAINFDPAGPPAPTTTIDRTTTPVAGKPAATTATPQFTG